MPVQEEFIAHAAPYRAELIAHCYRMLGSVHDAEDLVQETYLRGWRAYGAFEERAALRTWLYRIATTACLRALQNRARRALPAGLGAGSADPEAELSTGGNDWLEPLPDALTPEAAVIAKESIRLAVIAALHELPPRQRAVLILRDVVQFSAAEVAELLETTPAAVNSALQRARAHLAATAPNDDAVTTPDDGDHGELIERYCAAFEQADVGALTQLLQDEVKLEMPPFAVWFTGRDAVIRFLASRALTVAGNTKTIRTAANGQPAVAVYRRGEDAVAHAHAIHVLATAGGRIGSITVFLDPKLFTTFGLPATLRLVGQQAASDRAVPGRSR